MEEIAQVYARALFEVASDRDLLDTVRDQLRQFVDALNDNRDLAVFFFSPYFSTEDKKEALSKAIKDAEPIFISFLETLVERHRMPAIFRIGARYEELWEETHELLPVEITSAVELDKDTVKSIGEKHQRGDGPQRRALQPRRFRHPGWHRAPRGELHSRRIDSQPFEPTSQASGAGMSWEPRRPRSY